MTLFILNGGSSTTLVFDRDNFSMLGLTAGSPFWTASSCFCSVITALFSKASVSDFASSESSDNAAFHDFVRVAGNPKWSGIAPVEAPRIGFFRGEAGGESRLRDSGEFAVSAGAVLGDW